jgi:ribonuclease HI
MPPSKIYAAIFPEGKTGFYSSWGACSDAVKGKSNILFRGFKSRGDAEAWVDKNLNKTTPVQKNNPGVSIYVDGSFSPCCDKAGWGWVAVKKDIIVAGDYGVTPWKAESRNIDGEIEAAVQAIHWAHIHKQTCLLFHDYAGIAQWANGNWRAKSQIARYYIEKIAGMKQGVTFQKVTGHSGDKWNDYVDDIAKKGITEYLAGLKQKI